MRLRFAGYHRSGLVIVSHRLRFCSGWGGGGDQILATGSGPMLFGSIGIAEEAGGDLVVADYGSATVFRVDAITGDRTVVSNSTKGSGPALSAVFGIAVEADGSLVVTDFGFFATVLRIDPVTGDRAPVCAPCALPGDIDSNTVVDGNDIAGFIRIKLGVAAPGDDVGCANYGTGTLAGDIAAFVADLTG